MSQPTTDNGGEMREVGAAQVISMDGRYFAEISVPAGTAPFDLSPASIIQVKPVAALNRSPYTLAEETFVFGLIEETAKKEKRELCKNDFKDITTKLNEAFAGKPVYNGTKLAATKTRGPQPNGSTNGKEKVERTAVTSWNIPIRSVEAVLDHFTRGNPRERYDKICQEFVGQREKMYGSEPSKSKGKKRKVDESSKAEDSSMGGSAQEETEEFQELWDALIDPALRGQ